MSLDLSAKPGDKVGRCHVQSQKAVNNRSPAGTWINSPLSTSPPDHQQSDRRAVVDAVFPSVAYPSHSGEPQLVQMRNKKYWIRYMVNKNVGGYK
jgi:hypothetical protein